MERDILHIGINDPIEKWDIELFNLKQGDFIFLSENINNLILFSSFYTQHLIRRGNYEVTPIYGQLINNLETFIYQVNYSLPVSYKVRPTNHALYDLLLNFETEPAKRVLIWNDAQFLFNNHQKEFENIFELLIVAAYCNRNGLSTIKADGSRYKVDQRNIFFFHNMDIEDIKYLLDKEYYIPSIDSYPNDYRLCMDFNIIKLME